MKETLCMLLMNLFNIHIKNKFIPYEKKYINFPRPVKFFIKCQISKSLVLDIEYATLFQFETLFR